jgi:hypothetical protein
MTNTTSSKLKPKVKIVTQISPTITNPAVIIKETPSIKEPKKQTALAESQPIEKSNNTINPAIKPSIIKGAPKPDTVKLVSQSNTSTSKATTTPKIKPTVKTKAQAKKTTKPPKNIVTKKNESPPRKTKKLPMWAKKLQSSLNSFLLALKISIKKRYYKTQIYPYKNYD